jgi:hypothetical protein
MLAGYTLNRETKRKVKIYVIAKDVEVNKKFRHWI